MQYLLGLLKIIENKLKFLYKNIGLEFAYGRAIIIGIFVVGLLFGVSSNGVLLGCKDETRKQRITSGHQPPLSLECCKNEATNVLLTKLNPASLACCKDEAKKILVTILSNSDWKIRKAAVEELGEMAPEDIKASQSLIEKLKDNQPEVRRVVADRLGSCIKQASLVVPALIHAMEDKDKDTSSNAMRALGNLGPEAKAAIPSLIKLFEVWLNNEPNANPYSIRALMKIDTASEIITEKTIIELSSKNKQKQKILLERIGLLYTYASQAGSGASARLTLSFGNHRQELASFMMDALSCNDSEMQIIAAELLRFLGPLIVEARPLLIRMSREKDPRLRACAISGLTGYIPDYKDVMPVIINCLNDENMKVRLSAISAIKGFGPEAISAVPALISFIQDRPRRLSLIPEGAFRNILSFIFFRNKFIRMESLEAIAAIDPNNSLVLSEYIRNYDKKGNKYERIGVQSSLIKLGKNNSLVAPALVPFLKSEDQEIRFDATDAIGKIGQPAEVVVPALGESLNDDYMETRLIAANYLGDIKSDPELVMRTLIEHLNDENPNIRCSIIHSIGKFGPEAASAVPVLIGALKDECEKVRTESALALKNMGPAAKAAVPRLEEMLRQPEGWRECEAARKALICIVPERAEEFR